jgi:hypothetical protein
MLFWSTFDFLTYYKTAFYYVFMIHALCLSISTATDKYKVFKTNLKEGINENDWNHHEACQRDHPREKGRTLSKELVYKDLNWGNIELLSGTSFGL